MRVTIFPTVYAQTADTADLIWPDFVAKYQSPPTYGRKKECPLIKLASFGTARSDKGSLRHDENILSISGLEGDYDAGELPPETAAFFLTLAGVQAIVVTTASHTPDTPRWRVFAPLSREHAPTDRRELLGRLNCALGGILAPESFTLSQSYFVGRVAGVPFECYETEGVPIDLVPNLTPIFPPNTSNTSPLFQPVMQQEVTPAMLADLRSALSVLSADDRALWISVGQALVDLGDEGFAIWAQWSATSDKHRGEVDLACWRTFKGDRTGVASIFAKAQRAGWNNPRRGIDAAKVFGAKPAPFEDGIDPDLSHDQLARDLSLAGWSQDARYVLTWGRWLFWNGVQWELDDRLQHMTAVRNFIRAKADLLTQWAARKSRTLPTPDEAAKLIASMRRKATELRQASSVASVEQMARSNAELVASATQFDSDLNKLGTPTGVVNLKTGECCAPDRSDYITKSVSVDPAQPGTDAPLWRAFLNHIFSGDTEMIAFIQRMAGYALTGHTSEQKLIFLYGNGANGKSVFLSTLQWLLHDYARRSPAALFLDSRSESHPTSLAGLRGARLVVSSELPPGKSWDEAVIKDLTGGDTVTARLMRQDFFEYTPQFTLLIAGNHQPTFRSVDEAIRRRVLLLPFNVTIPKEERDPELAEKLKAEGSAILRWCVDGAVAWYREGLNPPARVEAASADYLEGEDLLGEFLDECTVCMTGASVQMKTLYQRFRE